MDTNESEVMPTARDADPVGKHSVTVLSPQLQNYYNKKLLQAIRNGDGNLKDLFKEFESIKKLTRIEINCEYSRILYRIFIIGTLFTI